MVSKIKNMLLFLFFCVFAANAKVPKQSSLKDSLILCSFLEAYQSDTILIKPEVQQNKKDFLNFVGLIYNNRYKQGGSLDSVIAKALGISLEDLKKDSFNFEKFPFHKSAFEFLKEMLLSEMMFERYTYTKATKANAFTSLEIYLSDEYSKADIDAFIADCKRFAGKRRQETVERGDSIYIKF